MTKTSLYKIFFSFSILSIVAIIPLNFVFAKEKLGFLFNEDLQKLSSASVTLSYSEYEKEIEIENYLITEPSLEERENYISEIENTNYCTEKQTGLFSVCTITQTQKQSSHPKKGALVYFNDEKLTKEIEDASDDLEKDPINGRFRMSENGKLSVVENSKSGYEVDPQETTKQILIAIQKKDFKKTSFIMKEVAPKISTENITSLGINELIGHGESDFRGSPKNRIHNIGVATEKFDGMILAPGEEFSFTTLLGPVDETTGYKKELVIKNNETIPEFGGGVCQVSTTMFRAALNTGLKITERKNHAYPVQYYSPQGTDATIYLPKPDLRFMNNTPGHVLIQAKIEGSLLSFDVYGTSDGREIELEGPFVTERTPDGRMRTVLYQKVKDSSGSYLVNDTFKSYYDNPDKYHPPEFTEKPKDWSNRQWDEYKVTHGL